MRRVVGLLATVVSLVVVAPASAQTVPNTGITSATVNSGATVISENGTTTTLATDASFSGFYAGPGDTVHHYECRRDGAAYATCTSPKNYTSLTGGSHTFDLRACATVGSLLCDASPATRTWTITPPVPNTGINTWTPGGNTTSTNASFSSFYVGASDVVDRYECRLDGASYATCTDPKSYSSLSTGSHTFDLRACNSTGCDASPATRTWTIEAVTYNGLSPNKYLSPSGSNANGPTCSSGSPCQTLAYAASIANAGDVWGLADGSYVGPGAVTRGGLLGSRIVYVAAHQYGAVVGSSGNSYPAFDVRAMYVDVEWLAVTADPDGGIALNGPYDRAIGNHVYAMTAPACGVGTGIWAGNGNDFPSSYGSHDQVITQNIVNDLGPAGSWADGDCPTGPHGIYVSVPNVTVTNNLVYHVVGGGITSWHAATAMQAINNTVVDAGQEGIEVGMGDSGSDGLGHRNALIQNNIVVSNGLNGISESGGPAAGNNHYYNNTLYNNPNDACAISCLTWSTDELNTTVGNPSFVTWSDDGNSGNDDFHLQSGSSAVDSGRATSAPGVDLNGTTRPTGGAVDRGAYER